MQETELTTATEPLRQGDIVQLCTPTEELFKPPLGVVINADCDLAHSKIDGVVAYLPLFPFEMYFQNFWIPQYAATRRGELSSQVLKACGKDGEQERALGNWLSEDGPEHVGLRLVENYKVKIDQILPKLTELHLINRAEKYDYTLLRDIFSAQQVDETTSLERLAKQALRNLGEGHLFLNEIAGQSAIGFVIRMRRILALEEKDVYRSISQFRSRRTNSPMNAVRICRLSPLFKFRVAQLFAIQFSRIGLPDELAELHETAVRAAMAELRSQHG